MSLVAHLNESCYTSKWVMSHRDYPGGQIGHVSQMGKGTNSQSQLAMGWLRSVGSIKLLVSFAEYRLFYKSLFAKETYNFVDPTNQSHLILNWILKNTIELTCENSKQSTTKANLCTMTTMANLSKWYKGMCDMTRDTHRDTGAQQAERAASCQHFIESIKDPIKRNFKKKDYHKIFWRWWSGMIWFDCLKVLEGIFLDNVIDP